MNLKEIDNWLQKINPDQMQAITPLIELGAQIAQYIAYTGSEVSKLKRSYQKAKKQAYYTTLERLKKEGKDVAPSLVKDYVGTLVADEEEQLILAERLNAALTHTLDFIRTCISALKTEMQTINNYNN